MRPKRGLNQNKLIVNRPTHTALLTRQLTDACMGTLIYQTSRPFTKFGLVLSLKSPSPPTSSRYPRN